MSSSTLKIIACITMLIDHVALGILCRMPAIGPANPVYISMRLIGRLAFPIYCFLIVEGFKYTKNRWLYALRMLIFCAISELPFDLAFWGSKINNNYQNVYFTLLIGLLVIWGMHSLRFKLFNNDKKNIFAVIFLDLIILAVGCLVAWFLKTDYSYTGVLTIAVMYFMRNSKRVGQVAAGCCILTLIGNFSEITSFVILPLMAEYNGQRGIRLKYFFYIFYPAHLFIIYLCAVALGVNNWIF